LSKVAQEEKKSNSTQESEGNGIEEGTDEGRRRLGERRMDLKGEHTPDKKKYHR